MEEDINLKASQDKKSEPKTLEKILILQKLLDKLSERKKALKDSKEKIFSEIDKNSFKYLEGKMNNKRVFDLILNRGIINGSKYSLIPSSKEFLGNLYEPACKFYFLLQNDNSLMMQITELSEGIGDANCEELSDFFVHFLYNNIIDSSFNEERLILMIYLHLKKQILGELDGNYLTKPFLKHVFNSLTRKFDLWNFLGTILNKNLIKIQNVKNILSVDIDKLDKEFKKIYKNSDLSLGKVKSDEGKKKLSDSTIKDKFKAYLPNKEEKFKLKRANRVVDLSDKIDEEEEKEDEKEENIEQDDSYNNLMKSFVFINDIDEFEVMQDIKDNKDTKNIKKPEDTFKKRKTDEINQNNNDNKNDKNIDNINNNNKIIINNSLNLEGKQSSDDSNKKEISINSSDLSKNKSDSSLKDEIIKKVNITKFLEENDVTKQKLIEKLNQYKSIEDIKENNNIYFAMEVYIKDLINKMEKEKSDSNKEKFEEIYSCNFIEKKIKSKIIMKRFYINYKFIISRINDIIKEISKNLESFPYYIKCIYKIINILLSIKYSNNYSHLKN